MKPRWDVILLLVIIVVIGVIWFYREGGFGTPEEPVVEPTGPDVVENVSVPGLQESFLVRVSAAGYDPDRLEVLQDAEVTITLRSTDGLPHGFALPKFGVSERVDPGEDHTFRFYAPVSGNHWFHSNVASSANEANVRGVLTVIPRTAPPRPE